MIVSYINVSTTLNLTVVKQFHSIDAKKKRKKKEKEEEDRKPKNIHKPDHSHSKFGISVGHPQQETEHGSIMHKLLPSFQPSCKILPSRSTCQNVERPIN